MYNPLSCNCPLRTQERVIAKYKMKSCATLPSSSSSGAAVEGLQPLSPQHSGPPSRDPKAADAALHGAGAQAESGVASAATGKSAQVVRPTISSRVEDQGMPDAPARETSPPSRQKMINAMTASTAGKLCRGENAEFYACPPACACDTACVFKDVN